jgi:cysteine desulfuration protein SufE
MPATGWLSTISDDIALAVPPAKGAHLGRLPCPFPPKCAPMSLSQRSRSSSIQPILLGMENAGPTEETLMPQATSFDEIIADFELLDDWEDRYRYVIELGRKLQPLPESARTAANKVQGCVSQVWLATKVGQDNLAPRLSFLGDSDAHIVRGLIAILFALYSGQTADAILGIDANAVLSRLHLKEHLTPQRSNGLVAMVERIRKDAREAIAKAPSLH